LVVDIALHPLRLFLSLFFRCPATTELYPLSLHDALPILRRAYFFSIFSGKYNNQAQVPIVFICQRLGVITFSIRGCPTFHFNKPTIDRSRRGSSHVSISYAVFCLKKKNTDLAVVGTATAV